MQVLEKCQLADIIKQKEEKLDALGMQSFLRLLVALFCWPNKNVHKQTMCHMPSC